jgi:hypothetical protein
LWPFVGPFAAEECAFMVDPRSVSDRSVLTETLSKREPKHNKYLEIAVLVAMLEVRMDLSLCLSSISSFKGPSRC